MQFKERDNREKFWLQQRYISRKRKSAVEGDPKKRNWIEVEVGVK